MLSHANALHVPRLVQPGRFRDGARRSLRVARAVPLRPVGLRPVRLVPGRGDAGRHRRGAGARNPGAPGRVSWPDGGPSVWYSGAVDPGPWFDPVTVGSTAPAPPAPRLGPGSPGEGSSRIAPLRRLPRASGPKADLLEPLRADRDETSATAQPIPKVNPRRSHRAIPDRRAVCPPVCGRGWSNEAGARTWRAGTVGELVIAGPGGVMARLLSAQPEPDRTPPSSGDGRRRPLVPHRRPGRRRRQRRLPPFHGRRDPGWSRSAATGSSWARSSRRSIATRGVDRAGRRGAVR